MDNACYFSPFIAEGFIGLLARLRISNFAILGGNHRRNTERYFAEHNLPVDFGGRARDFDLLVTTTDTYVPSSILGIRIVMAQEGMIEPQALPGQHTDGDSHQQFRLRRLQQQLDALARVLR